MYHHDGASGYLLIILICTSAFSRVLDRHCLMMCSPWCRYVYTSSDAMAAKERP